MWDRTVHPKASRRAGPPAFTFFKADQKDIITGKCFQRVPRLLASPVCRSQWRSKATATRKSEQSHSLTWGDVLWDKGRFRVRATKTAHMEGHEIGFGPLGPILPYLEAAFDEAVDGDKRVVTRFIARM
jgi:hypothetical protein